MDETVWTRLCVVSGSDPERMGEQKQESTNVHMTVYRNCAYVMYNMH